MGVGGVGRRPGLDGRECGSRCRSCASRAASARRGASTPRASSAARTRAPGSSWCRRTRAGCASRMAHLTGLDGLRPQRAPRAAALHGRARRVRRSPARRGDPFNDGSRAFAAGGPRPEVGRDQQPHAQRHRESRFRPGRGRSGGRQPHGVRDVLPGEAAVLPRRRADLRQLRRRAAPTTSGASTRPSPTIFYSRRIGRAPQVRAVRRLHRCAGRDDDPRAPPSSPARPGTAAGAWACSTPSPSERDRAHPVGAVRGEATGRAAHELLGGARAARLRPPRRRRLARRPPSPGGWNAGAAERPARRAPTSSAATATCFLDAKRDWVVDRQAGRQPDSGHRPTTIARAQRAAQRYYQRPDAPQVELDPTADLARRLQRAASTSIATAALCSVNAALWGVSPGFESNDLGFLTHRRSAGAPRGRDLARRDAGPLHARAGTPGWPSGGPGTSAASCRATAGTATAGSQFLNYWNVERRARAWRRGARRPPDARRAVRARPPGGGFWNINVNTDERHGSSIRAGYNWSRNDAGGSAVGTPAARVNIKPSPADDLTRPAWNATRHIAQYVRIGRPIRRRGRDVRRPLCVRLARPAAAVDDDARQRDPDAEGVDAGVRAAAARRRRLRRFQGAGASAHLRLPVVRPDIGELVLRRGVAMPTRSTPTAPAARRRSRSATPTST